MALLVCTTDLVPHAVGSPACPECGCTVRIEQGSPEHEALLAEKAAPKKPARKPVNGKAGESSEAAK